VAALLAVEGVAGASVEPVGGGPGTLRLQLKPGTDEVRVAGAVNRLLRARFGLAVDADRVRIVDEAGPLPPAPPAPAGPSPAATEAAAETPAEAAIEAAAEGPTEAATSAAEGQGPARGPDGGPTWTESYAAEPAGGVVTGSADELPEVQVARPGRLAIQRVQLDSAGLGVAVTVSLGLDGRTVTGHAEGAATQSGVHRSVATATLRAVESVLEGNARFEVDHVELTRTGTDQTVLVVLTMVTGRSTQRLSGASVVREDVRQAVIRAVLAAVNRRMEPMLAHV
jgi:hypothetical protein